MLQLNLTQLLCSDVEEEFRINQILFYTAYLRLMIPQKLPYSLAHYSEDFLVAPLSFNVSSLRLWDVSVALISRRTTLLLFAN